MRLHEKTLATTALLTGIVILALYGSTQAIVTNSAVHTEEEHVRQHVDRIFMVLSTQLTNLDAVAGDWAAWDDTYRFVVDANQEYVKSNLVDQTFVNLRINLLLIVDSSGSIVFGKAFDLSDMTEEPIPSGLDRMLSPTGKLVHHESAESKTVGIVILDGMPMFVASRPILTSDAQGPIRGTFIMGVFLDSTEMSRLSEILDEVVAVRAITDAEMPADFQDALASLSDSTTITVRPLSEERVAGYGLLDDIYGEPALILRIDEPRDFYGESQTLMSYLGLSLLVVCAIFGVTTLYSLERLVLSPLASLGADVNRVRLSGFVSPDISARGGEEFTSLAGSINMMMDALRTSERKFRTLFENVPQGIYQTSAEGKLLTANPALVRLLGYSSRTELLSVDVENDLYVHPEERRRWVKELEIRGKIRDEELVLKRKDGSQLTVLDNAHLVFDDHGTVLYQEGTLTDITDRKRMERELATYSEHLQELVDERTEKLAESERRFRELSDLLPQTVFEMDEKGNLSFFNLAAFKTFGYIEEDLRKGLNAFQMIAPEDRNRAKQRVRRLLEGEDLGGTEYSMQRKDGSTFPAIVHSTPIARENKSVGLRGIAVDITERKRIEEELRSARERLEYVIVSNPAAIFTGKPRKDYSDYEVTYMSESVASLVGFEPQEFIGHPQLWESRIHPDDLRKFQAEIPLLWKQGKYTFEHQFLHKEGTYRWMREEARVIRDADGSPVEVVGCWTDITEQKRTQEALLRSERLAGVGETVMMVGHDLRNPLQVMMNSLAIVEQMRDSMPSDCRDYVDKHGLNTTIERVERQLEYMNKIISDLQDYARPVRPEPASLRMADFLGETLSNIPIPKNITVTLEASEEVVMRLDPVLMRRVFTNLITNATQAMPTGGSLRIVISKREGLALIEIGDTGVGIPEENLTKLFHPLFTTKAKGQGLGLPVCKRLVEAHDGSITVTSRVGVGTTFTVSLPTK